MLHIADYIEKTLEKYPYDDILLKFEHNTLDDAKALDERVRKTGLTDETVIADLIKAGHPDLCGEYETFRKEEIRSRREKKWNGFLAKAVPAWLILMIAVYLGVSFTFKTVWRESWLIIVAFVTVLVWTGAVTLIWELSRRRRIFHPIARVGLALAIMMLTSFIFLFIHMYFATPHLWVMFPGGVITFMAADLVYARILGQKLRIINALVYIPFMAAMLFVILCGTKLLPWSPGWLIVIGGLVADIIIAIAKAIDNSKYVYRPEDDE